MSRIPPLPERFEIGAETGVSDPRPAEVRAESLSRGSRIVKGLAGSYLSTGYTVIPSESDLLKKGVDIGFFKDEDGNQELVVKRQKRVDIGHGYGYMGDGQIQTIAGEEAVVDNFVRRHPSSFVADGEVVIWPTERDNTLASPSPKKVADLGMRLALVWKNGMQVFRAIPESSKVFSGEASTIPPNVGEPDAAGLELVVKGIDDEGGLRQANELMSRLGRYMIGNPAEFDYSLPKNILPQIDS